MSITFVSSIFTPCNFPCTSHSAKQVTFGDVQCLHFILNALVPVFKSIDVTFSTPKHAKGRSFINSKYT